MASEEELTAIAAELIVVPPSEFVRARDARARATEDAELARQIRTWRRPSAAAWAVDALVRLAPDEASAALVLAEQLRDAQDDLDARALSALNRQRRTLVAALAERAVEIADGCGVAVSGAARDDIERTLNAAMRDPRAAAAVRSGRLVRALDASGLEPVELEGAVLGAPAETPAPPRPPRDDLAERRERREAERARAAAQRQSATAQRELARAERAVEKAAERAALLADRRTALERELARVAADADAAETARDEARATRDAAARTARAAARRAGDHGLSDSS